MRKTGEAKRVTLLISLVHQQRIRRSGHCLSDPRRGSLADLRELLAVGLAQQTGDDDVAVGPHPDTSDQILIELDSPEGHAALAFQRADLVHVLELSLQLVPWHYESRHIDWEQELALLGGHAL
jgi:hypothetical protein